MKYQNIAQKLAVLNKVITHWIHKELVAEAINQGIIEYYFTYQSGQDLK